MSVTYKEHIARLKNEDVCQEWAMVWVLDLQAFNALLRESFQQRSVAASYVTGYSLEIALGASEEVEFTDVHFSEPQLWMDAETSEAVLSFYMVGGRYERVAPDNGVRYLVERIEFSRAHRYALELRVPVGALQLCVDDEGTITWQWPAGYSAYSTLGSTDKARETLGKAMLEWLQMQSLVPEQLITHRLPSAQPTPLLPRQGRLGLSASGDNDGRYSVNVYLTSALLPNPGTMQMSPPICCPVLQMGPGSIKRRCISQLSRSRCLQ
ncbi:hypothetical protein [Pseudomonas sp. KNUC1026]|uniref:hypothetical protein n=1 Tax=Pseudomonas sp. KNUC1026 TaxID=2893890 RepID=UPI001F333BAF|nr:hypothetical protein [Pseudomonas sp. KNUC1026]UFH48280.1 hypothetical protein LN139_14010 [Pseudomonas sp. KNUC1026]